MCSYDAMLFSSYPAETKFSILNPELAVIELVEVLLLVFKPTFGFLKLF